MITPIAKNELQQLNDCSPTTAEESTPIVAPNVAADSTAQSDSAGVSLQNQAPKPRKGVAGIRTVFGQLIRNQKFRVWFVGFLLCFATTFTVPFIKALNSSATLKTWIDALCAGEVIIIGVTAMLTALSDSVRSLKDLPVADIAVLGLGLFFHVAIKAASSLSASPSSLNTTLALGVTIFYMIAVLIRCVNLYLIDMREGKA